jgi:uncharacterized protein (TIGR03066 family)
MIIRVATLLGALLALTLASPAQDKKDDPQADAKKLLGKWKLTKIEPGELPEGQSIVLEVEKGKFKIIVTQGDVKDINEGTWKFDAKKIAIEFTEGSRKGMKQTDTVKEVTEKKLVLVDEREMTEYWERVEEKKDK